MNLTFSLRPTVEADLPRMVEIYGAQAYEPTTLEETLRLERNRRPEDPLLRLTAVSPDGTVLGYGITGTGIGSKPGEYNVKVRVDAPYERNGIGQALYATLEAWTREQGGMSATTSVNEVHPHALAWAERRGYVQEHHIFKSKLSLPDWDPAPFTSAVQRAKAEGFRFTDLATELAAGGEQTYRQYYDFIGPIVDDMPGAAGRTRAPYERWREVINNLPNWDPRRTILALDGDRWVGFAAIEQLPSGTLFHGFTGVDRACRGRGLALAVKVVALTYVKSLGADHVITSNHSSNQPMLAVNRRLGYVPLPGSFTLRKALG